MNRRFITAAVFLATGVAWQAWLSAAEDSSKLTWAMLGHDVARSGATSSEIRPPFSRKWYRVFPDEGLQAGVQPVVAGGRIFLSAKEEHTIHALDMSNGKPLWSYTVGSRVDSPPTIYRGLVLFGSRD